MGRTLGRKADAGDLVAWSRPPVHPRQARMIRVHEAGHAVATLMMENSGWTLIHVDAQTSVSPTGLQMHGSVLARCPAWIPTRADAVPEIAQNLAGRAAEHVVVGEVTSGSAIDLEQSTGIAVRVVRQYGLDGTLIHLAERSPIRPDEVPRIEAILRDGWDLAVSLVTRWQVRVLADMLEERPFMTGAEVRAALREWHLPRFFRDDDRAWEDAPMAA